MKQKLGSLLIIGGAALGGFRYNCLNNIPSLLICAIGGFLIGFSYLLFTSAYSGIIWGITIKSSILSKMKTLTAQFCKPKPVAFQNIFLQ